MMDRRLGKKPYIRSKQGVAGTGGTTLIGVLPTVPVEPTIEGIREGREVLERAVEIVSSP